MAYNNSNQGSNSNQQRKPPYQGKPTGNSGGGGGRGKKQSILLFKATDKETGEPKLNKAGKEYYRVSLTQEQVDFLCTAKEGAALYMEEQSGTSKKTGRDYSGYAISVLPPRD